MFDEGHCEAIGGVVCDVANFRPWLTTAQAQTELVEEVFGKHRGSSTGIKPTVAVVRETAKRWKAMIDAAATFAQQVGEGEWRQQFVAQLVTTKARSLAEVNAAYARISKARATAEKRHAEELRRLTEQADEEAERQRGEAERAARIEELTGRVLLGDARDLIARAPAGFHLLLTDPPWGKGYQSHRRKTTAQKAGIANDDPALATALLGDVLRTAYPLMADDSTALVFTGWEAEPAFRAAIEAAGFVVKGVLVWVKNNHGTGDLAGAFAPRHELIIHAVKGSPRLRQRPDDVLFGKDRQDSDHPTEKPRDLLRTLIEATTDEGQTVVDPFAGSGSTLFAALDAARDFWGVEIDEVWHRKITDGLLAASSAPAEED